MSSFLALLLSIFTLMELNCENLFDTQHDSLKQDQEFLPESYRHWNNHRYWSKLDHIGQAIVSSDDDFAEWQLPDIVALCEVENDTVLFDLTKRSLLRGAHYEYLMTNSPDQRGIDVALLYQPLRFSPIQSYSIRIHPIEGMRPTRDILYVAGRVVNGDTLHVFVVHAPSRTGGERASRPFRMHVAQVLCESIDSIKALQPQANIIVTGDFNDYSNNKSLEYIANHDMTEISKDAKGKHGAKGTYRFRGEWGSLDHIFCSRPLADKKTQCVIADRMFLMEEDEKYGGLKPKRNYNGARWNDGFSDHLPIVAKFNFDDF